MKRITILFTLLLLAQAAFSKKVHFRVDMTGQVKSPNGIHVMGDFQSIAGFGADWTPNTCQMTQDAVDTNLYHFYTDLPAFTKYEFKYLNGDQSYEVEVVPVETQVGYNFDDNRWIYIDSLNSDTMHFAPVIFGENAPAGLQAVRFLVDMTSEPFDANGVHVAGGFQGNNPATHRLYSFGNNVFELIAYVDTGNLSYKFYNGNTASDAETVPASCASAGNRVVNITNDVILASVCFSGCSSCYPTFVQNVVSAQDGGLSPNPMSDYCNLQLGPGMDTWNVAIVDLHGNYLRKYMQISQPVLQITRQDLLPGNYHIVMENQSGYRRFEKLTVH